MTEKTKKYRKKRKTDPNEFVNKIWDKAYGSYRLAELNFELDEYDNARELLKKARKSSDEYLKYHLSITQELRAEGFTRTAAREYYNDYRKIYNNLVGKISKIEKKLRRVIK